MSTSAEKMAEYRRKRKAKGQVMTQIWLKPEEHEILSRLIRQDEFRNQSEVIAHALRQTFNTEKGADAA